ncbi:MAG: FeoB-associated Cys-rich membrane protein [Clostridiaceae bacterium]|nr:FeoB-associated Cys-rich membrane protein [Clostridiaceae bacterium]
MINWIIGGVIILVTILIVARSLIRLKEGKSGCNCDGCSLEHCSKKSK